MMKTKLFSMTFLLLCVSFLHGGYEYNLKRAFKSYDRKVEYARETLDKAFQSEIAKAMKRNDVQEAKEVKEMYEAWKDGESPEFLDKEENTKDSGDSDKPFLVVIYVNAADSYSLYLNGRRIASGDRTVKKLTAKIKSGDVFTARYSSGDWHGFNCVIRSKDLIISTGTSVWKAYLPKSKQKWYDPLGIEKTSQTVSGCPGAFTVAKPLNETAGVDVLPIASDLGPSRKTGYLCLTVE